MAAAFIFAIVLQTLLYAICSGESCSGNWSTETTKYSIINFQGNSYVLVRCWYPNFKVDGEGIIRCIHGQLPTFLPQCIRMKNSCHHLKAPTYGSMKCSSTAPEEGSSCTFECQSSYYLRGTRTRTCSALLRWTGSQARCYLKPECWEPPPLRQGTVTGCSPERKPRFNDTCHFRCNEGYQLKGPTHLICRRDGRLTDERGHQSFPSCIRILPVNPGPAGKEIPPANFGPGVNLGGENFRNTHHPYLPTHTPSCQVSNGHCSHICNQEPNGVRCSCSKGYELSPDGRTCIDIDECRNDESNNCDHMCRNTLGGYVCLCREGYVSPDGFRCTEIPPVNPGEHFRSSPYPNVSTYKPSCQVRNGDCSHQCHQEINGVRCSCREGYELHRDGRTCTDIDECNNEESNKCDHMCRNTLGGFVCLCREGYVSTDGFRCTEIPPMNPGEHFRNTPHTKVSTYKPSCQVRNGDCSHQCHQVINGVLCSCREGYELHRDGRTCIDIDECNNEESNKCDHMCRNTLGGFVCLCREGYISPDGFRCTDVNECLDDSLNKCEQICQNTMGGYNCSCRAGFLSTNGFRCEGCRVSSYRSIIDTACRDCPANSYTDGEAKTSINDCICNVGFNGNPGERIPCKDIDECSDGKNFGCSHNCVNTPGSAHCTCPLGYQLKDDGKTCTDIDECSLKNGGCDGICHNTVGNFSCSCHEGYVASPYDRYSCDDVDECVEGNGGCSDKCVNFKGGFHCFCSEGYHLHPDGKSCIPVHCPRVSVPQHSTLRCKKNATTDKVIYRPRKMPEDEEFPVGAACKVKCDKGYDLRDTHSEIVCQNNGKWNASLSECQVLKCPPLSPPSNGDVYPPSCKKDPSSVKQKCVFTCLPGYRITGQEVLTCRNNLTWSKKKPTECVPETEVSISCPEDDITIELRPDESWAEIRLNSPRTTQAAGPIRVSPPWVSLDQVSPFPAGETEVIFSVTKDNKTAECSIFVVVLDTHPPVFHNCPSNLFVTSGVFGTAVDWEEPVPDDNVGIASVSKNLEPNSTLSPGIHFVEYIARDISGNIGQCIFFINVTAGGCKDLADPENGEANCQEWMFGKICQPTCFDNYIRDPELFACDESGTWTPTDFITPCLPECLTDETWSPELQKCVKTS